MNHREQTHRRRGVRRALHCLLLLLLPAVGPRNLRALQPTRPSPGRTSGSESEQPSQPYLPMLGAPALRFQPEPPPVDLTPRTASGAPPVPALSPTETTVAQANLAAARSVPAPAPAPAIVPPAETPPPPEVPADTTKPAAAPSPAAPARTAPAAILPDDSRPAVRAEDFLPYFQIPGASRQPADLNVIMPAPRGGSGSLPVPPSSATYTQTPK